MTATTFTSRPEPTVPAPPNDPAATSTAAHTLNDPATAESRLASATRLTVGAATITVGLAAGLFGIFADVITPGLASVDDRTYVGAFQAINDAVRTPAFAVVFFGSIPLLCAALALSIRTRVVAPLAVGSALVLYATTFAVTAAGNVALNRDLAAVDDDAPAALAAARTAFEDPWNDLNLLRTATCVLAFVALVVALARNPASDRR